MLLGLAALGCRPEAQPTAAPAAVVAAHEPVASPEPASGNELDQALSRLEDPDTRARGLAELDRMALAAKTDEQRQALAEAFVPAFLEIWDEALPHRLTMLRVSLSLEHAAAAPLWNRAIGLDGSASSKDATLLALDGVKATHATSCTRAVIDALEHLLLHPELDGGEREGEVRAVLLWTLEELGAPEAVPVLLSVLEQPIERQPVGVYRVAAGALGRLRAVEAVDALLRAPFRIPDIMSTTNIAEQAKIALAAIGEPAVPSTVTMLEGKHAGVQELAALHGLSPDVVEMSAASYLGAIGSPDAIEPLLARFPRAGCRGQERQRKPAAPDDLDFSMQSRRAVIANALGLIGDARAVGALCQCSNASKNPGDMFPIAEALGRIGGPEATACLTRVVSTAAYDEDTVADRSYVHELRWEAARFLILAASADELRTIEKLLSASRRPPEVARNQEQWRPGLDVLQRCGRELPCFLEVLGDEAAPWFSREVAATQAARLAPGDEAVALAIANAYAIADPDARVTMAWLVARMMYGRRCQACADALQRTMDQARNVRLPAEYQLSVLQARYTIARVRE